MRLCAEQEVWSKTTIIPCASAIFKRLVKKTKKRFGLYPDKNDSMYHNVRL
jgi:hypothetical protein